MENELFMNDVVFRMLLELRRVAREEQVFTQSSLRCKDLTHLARVFRTDCERVGVRPIRFHDLRHTFATQFVSSGGSLFHLAGILGHSTTTMTARYAHFCRDQARAVAETVSFDVPVEKGIIQFGNGHKVVTENVGEEKTPTILSK